MPESFEGCDRQSDRDPTAAQARTVRALLEATQSLVWNGEGNLPA